MAQRFRTVRVEWRGWPIARIRDNETGEVIGVYRKLGRWRVFGTDEQVPTRAGACARRALEGADLEALRQERREELGLNG